MRECAEELATSQGLWPVGLRVLGSMAFHQSPSISGRYWTGRFQTPDSEAMHRAPLLPGAAVTGRSGSEGHEASQATGAGLSWCAAAGPPAGGARGCPPTSSCTAHAWGWGLLGLRNPSLREAQLSCSLPRGGQALGTAKACQRATHE